MTKHLLAVLILLSAAAQAGASVLAVYHTSDVHGWYSARPAAWDNTQPGRLIGGFAALSAHLKKETTPYILLDSGDMWQGTPEGMFTRGLASAELMNMLDYSATVPGNHDYDYGEPALRALAAAASFPILAANIHLKRGHEYGPEYLEPYTVIEKAGHKIAVIGLAGRHTATSTRPSNVKHLVFTDEGKAAARVMKEIKPLGPDAVIVISHLGLSHEYSLKHVDISTRTLTPSGSGTLPIARAAAGIDLILGGHNHTVLLNGWKDKESGTWFGESGYGLSYVTRALLDFDDKTGRLKDITMETLPLWKDETGEDKAVLKKLEEYAAQVEEAMGIEVGRAKGDLMQDPDWLDSSIGNFLCDLTRAYARTDLAFHNTKSIRADIPKGPVKLRQLYQSFPFDNNIITMRLTGAQVRRLIEDSLGYGRAYMQVSGLEVEFRPGSGRRAELVRLIRGGKEIKADDEFTVATNDYLAFGGTGGDAFADGKDVKDTMLPTRDLVRKAFEAGPVTPPSTGRIRKIK